MRNKKDGYCLGSMDVKFAIWNAVIGEVKL